MDFLVWQTAAVNFLNQFSREGLERIKLVLFALSWLLLGLILAEAAKRLTRWAWSRVGLDRVCRRLGWEEQMRKNYPAQACGTAAGEAVYWFFAVLFFMQALHKSEWGWPAALGGWYVEYLPHLGYALLLLALSAGAARLGSWLLHTFSRGRFGALSAEWFQWLTWILGSELALETLGFERALLFPLFAIALAVGFSLSGWQMLRSGEERFWETIRVETSEEA